MTTKAMTPVSKIFAKGKELVSSRLFLSVGAQGLVSGFHFALNLLLLRLVTPFDYGIFAFAFVLAMFASAINNALISTPLTVYTPVIKNPSERAQQEAMFSTLNILLFVLLLLAGVIYSTSANLDSDISLAVTAFVAIYSARHYSRSAGYARMRPLITATGDSVYVVAGLLIVLTLLLTQDKLGITSILYAIAAANLAAMIVERTLLHGNTRKWLSFGRLNTYGAVWLQSRWALVGSLTTLFLAQAHSVIITSTNGPNAYAPLAAGFVLFGPVRVALLTWQNMVKPELAVALSESREDAVRIQIKTTTLLMAGAVLAMGLFLWIAWPLIHKFLYAKQYADQPMAYIVGLWSVITLFAASYNAPAAALQAMRDFKVLAIASIYGALLSGVMVAVILYYYRPENTLLGILAAEVFMAIYLTYTLYSRLRIPSVHGAT
ncbi:MAG: O-antigen/teichoic acid export membrane protein [Granulosicoccus sp.]|jgi:O-antigen/teichoic acid export membrane protein